MDTTIQIRTTSKIKKEAMKVFKKEGISMSSAFNAFLEEVERKGSLPVTVYPQEKVPAPVAKAWRVQMEKDLKNFKKGDGYTSAEGFLKDFEKNFK
jgi:addiction module RelB/DinJ family antitoxin